MGLMLESDDPKQKRRMVARRSKRGLEKRSNSFSVKCDDGDFESHDFLLANESIMEEMMEIVPHQVCLWNLL